MPNGPPQAGRQVGNGMYHVYAGTCCSAALVDKLFHMLNFAHQLLEFRDPAGSHAMHGSLEIFAPFICSSCFLHCKLTCMMT